MVLCRPLLLLFTRTCIVVLCLATVATNTDAFVVSGGLQRPSMPSLHPASDRVASSIATGASLSRGLVVLSERRWNFNEGQEPWGMKKNAEIWNGRVAQVVYIIPIYGQLTLFGQSFLSASQRVRFSSFTLNIRLQDGIRNNLHPGAHPGEGRDPRFAKRRIHQFCDVGCCCGVVRCLDSCTGH
jgi:hypothetical protein